MKNKKRISLQTLALPALAACALAPAPAADCCHAAGAARPVLVEKWGALPDGRAVSIFTLDNGRGLRVRVSDFGAVIASIETPAKNGVVDDIALGYPALAGYMEDAAGTYFGSVVGRVANRIGKGRFTLDGKTYKLATNNTPGGLPCTLHGGKIGYNKVLWTARVIPGESPSVVLSYRSPDGEEGFPGNLDLTVTYTVRPDNTLRIEYAAVTDKATPVNLSQHSYFNLAGEGNGTILNHRLRIGASRTTPVDIGLIPTGRLQPVAGTPLDFLQPHAIGERVDAADEQLKFGAGYDHNWALDGWKPGNKELLFAAEVFEPLSGRVMTVLTTEPGLQFYCGNFLDGTIKGKSGKPYLHRGGIALETQHFPDSPNQPDFPSIILRPGKRYESATELKFST
ncbi:MAG: galactose mutarotase, partial [Opitutaceae bacterium]|nr:galactose mutarotase [Opitutaceae bacterium]